MDEPKRHVVEDYPARDLPEKLRNGFAPNATVKVTVEAQSWPQQRAFSFEGFFDTMANRDYGTTIEEATRRIRDLRDED